MITFYIPKLTIQYQKSLLKNVKTIIKSLKFKKIFNTQFVLQNKKINV